MYNAQNLVDKIKTKAKEKNILIRDLLKACDLNINALNTISDKKGLSSFSLAKIADYLNCSVDYLLGRTDNPNLNSQTETEKEIKFETFGDIIEFINALSKTYGIEFKIIDREETEETHISEGYKESCNIVFPLYSYGASAGPDTISPKSARANVALAPFLRQFQDIQNKIDDCINASELTNSQKAVFISHYEFLIKNLAKDYKIEDSLELEDIWALRDKRNKDKN